MILELLGLEKRLGNFHLGPIDLKIKENLILLGPTGSGKTTLLELIAGFKNLDSGKIYFNNKDITNIPPEKRKIGFLYQDFQLFPHMNVFKNISYGLEMMKMSRKSIENSVNDIAKKFKISHLLEREIYNLSAGEKQRVALARALIIEPEILLLDEPFSALDEEIKNSLIDEFIHIIKDIKSLVILVSHNQEDAYRLGNQVAIIFNGKILACGYKDNVFKEPKTVSAAKFLGFTNIFSNEDMKKIGIEADGEFFTIDDSKIFINSNGKINLKGRIETYEYMKNKVKIVINVNGVKIVKRFDNFMPLDKDVNVSFNPDDFIRLKS
ncbi:MAG: ATP-binding cassette domain-containing protein [Thermoplasmata archaeon]